MRDLDVPQSYGPPRPVTEMALTLPFTYIIFNLNLPHRIVWHSGNTLDLYSWGDGIKPRPRPQPFWGLLRFSSVPPGKCRDRTWIMPWPLPTKSFPIYHSSVTRPFICFRKNLYPNLLGFQAPFHIYSLEIRFFVRNELCKKYNKNIRKGTTWKRWERNGTNQMFTIICSETQIGYTSKYNRMYLSAKSSWYEIWWKDCLVIKRHRFVKDDNWLIVKM
jgi:hypothetical protein